MQNQTLEIPVEQIIVHRNDRKVFDVESLNELSTSIAKHGILQNLIVRPVKDSKDRYELVAGERRLKAGMKTGLTSIPCTIKDLDDETTSEVMLIENLQREDIHPLDEAESFARLIEKKLAPKTIALKIGKSLKYVKERLSLNNLHPDAKQLFLEDDLQLGHALILCLFGHEQQIEAVKAVVRHEQGFHYFDNPVDLKQYMNRNVLLNLSTAIFDTGDPKLDKKAGACTACPKQTGANQQLFACITDEAKCLDKACFFRKTELTININNKRLLKQFSKKPSDCALITDNYYAYEDEVLARNHWRNVEQSDECPNVTLGIESDREEHSIVRMVCLNKKCAVHFPKEEGTRPTEVPENESKTDMVLRRMKKRRAKEKIKDHHTARNEYRKEIGNVQSEVINEWELGYVLNKLCWNAPGYLTELAQEAGFLKAGENLAWNNREKFVKYLQGKGLNFMFMFIRKLIALENLNPDDKYITETSVGHNYLLQQGKSLDLDFKPILKKHLDARKENYAAENKAYKDLVKKEKEKAKRIDHLIKNAKQEYPFLHEVLQSKKRNDVLEKQSLETLSKMTFRLGLKRKKDGDTAYYVETIIEGLSSLESDQKKD